MLKNARLEVEKQLPLPMSKDVGRKRKAALPEVGQNLMGSVERLSKFECSRISLVDPFYTPGNNEHESKPSGKGSQPPLSAVKADDQSPRISVRGTIQDDKLFFPTGCINPSVNGKSPTGIDQFTSPGDVDSSYLGKTCGTNMVVTRPFKKRRVQFAAETIVYPFFGQHFPPAPKVLALRCLEFLDCKNWYSVSLVNSLWSEAVNDDALWE